MIKIVKSNLITILELATSVIDNKAIQPILKLVAIETKENEVSFRTIGNEMNFKMIDKPQISKPINICVEGKRLLSICQNIEADEITIEQTENNRLIINANKSNFVLYGYDINDYPILPVFETKLIVEMDKAKFDYVVSKVNHIANVESEHQFFRGSYLVFNKDVLLGVATDGSRMNLINEKVEIKIDEMKNILLNKNVLNVVKKIKSVNIKLFESAKQVVFIFDNLTLTANKIEGEYPDYTKVIPTSFNYSLEINKLSLMRAVKRAVIMSDDAVSRGVVMDINEGKVELTTNDPTVGECVEQVECKILNGVGNLKVAFNGKYLMDVLNSIDSTEIQINVIDEKSPILFIDNANKDNKFVLMPMRF
jgi:DNA polymerase-3 subunit beta